MAGVLGELDQSVFDAWTEAYTHRPAYATACKSKRTYEWVRGALARCSDSRTIAT